MASKLTPKQEKFIDEYLKDLNGTQAAIRAGYSPRSANEMAARLLAKDSISSEIASRRQKLSDDCGITRERVVKEMARLAFLDIRKFFDDEGNPIHISKLDDDCAAAVNGFDVATTGNSEIGVGQILKYKIPDKNKALDNLAKILGYLDKDRQKEGVSSDGVYILEIKRATKPDSITD